MFFLKFTVDINFVNKHFVLNSNSQIFAKVFEAGKALEYLGNDA